MSLNNVYVEETSDVDFEYSIKAFKKILYTSI